MQYRPIDNSKAFTGKPGDRENIIGFLAESSDM